ncbi:MAG: hypothetical protein AABZ06_03340 [Bdellovibrionota bacterium]
MIFARTISLVMVAGFIQVGALSNSHADGSTEKDVRELIVYLAQLMDLYSHLPVYELHEAEQIAHRMIVDEKLDALDVRQLVSQLHFSRDQHGMYIFPGVGAVEISEELLVAQIDTNKFFELYKKLFSLKDQYGARYLYVGAAAFFKAEDLLKSRVPLDRLSKNYDCFRYLVDPANNRYLFPGASAFEMSEQLALDLRFDLDRFIEVFHEIRLKRDPRTGRYLYPGVLAVNKTLEIIGIHSVLL